MTTTEARLRRARFTDVYPLRTLFVHALKTDFNYFPPGYIKQVNRQHTMPHLAVSLLKKHRIIVLAALNDNVVGFIIGSGHEDAVGEVYWLYVHPSQRGQRLGSKLLYRALDELRSQGMKKVRLMTHQYENYYAKYGFEMAGTYKIDTLEVAIMELPLEPRTRNVI